MGKDEQRDPDTSDVLELNSDTEAEAAETDSDVDNPDRPDDQGASEKAGDGMDEVTGDGETEPEESQESPASGDRMEIARLENRVRQLEEENRNLKDTLLRKMAEFENLKKRTAREKDEAVRYGTAGVLTNLLEVLDNFDRALAIEPDVADHHSFYEGMKLIARHLFDILKSEGLVEINPKEEPFDPFFHEAMMRKESTEFPENTVLEVFQKGYKLRDRLLRPARVMVSTRPAEEAVEEPVDEPDTASDEPDEAMVVEMDTAAETAPEREVGEDGTAEADSGEKEDEA